MNLPKFGENSSYNCWLTYRKIENSEVLKQYIGTFSNVSAIGKLPIFSTALNELSFGLEKMLGISPKCVSSNNSGIIIGVSSYINTLSNDDINNLKDDGYIIKYYNQNIIISGKNDRGVLYGVFAFLRLVQLETPLHKMNMIDNPSNMYRMINQWDNFDGSIERGYAGNSIFYENNKFIKNKQRVQDYARLLASVGINSIVLNNVNVHYHETRFITKVYLPEIARLADIFRKYGITIFLSVDFASPIELGNLSTADPLDKSVAKWWRDAATEIYHFIPDFGGFLVKADSESRPGPFTYGRDHAEGANMLASALKPYGGVVIWRCFVYNCKQDWRDTKTDRANAAYDNFMPLDGQF